MALEPKERIIIPDEDGEEHLFETLFTFTIDKTNTSYVAVVPADQVEAEEVEVFAFRYEEKGPEADDLALFPIETDEEWDMVEEMLNTLAEEEDTSL